MYAINPKMQGWITRFVMADIIEIGVNKYAMIVPEELYQACTAKD